MPAVTADTLTLPRLPEPDAGAAERPVAGVFAAPVSVRGRGLPRPAGLRRCAARGARPVHPPRPDGRRRLRPGRAAGHRLAPPPRLRDRDLHARRHLPAPGLQRRRRRHHRRRHPVDDRRWRDPPHRDPARGAGRERRPVPRAAAVGEPPVRRQAGRAPLPEPRGRAGHAAGVGRRRGAGPDHRRRRGRAHRPRVDPHADHLPPRHGGAGGPAPPAVAARLQRPGLRPVGLRPGRVRRAGRSARATSSSSGPGDHVLLGPTSPGPRPRTWRSWCSAGSPSASRSPGTGRS